MLCSTYFGVLSDERKKQWNCGNNNPYVVLKSSIKLDGKGHTIWDDANRYFENQIQIDWGSFAWKCKGDKCIEFLKTHQSTLPWLVERDQKMIDIVTRFIIEHAEDEYGVVFIEEC